MRIGGNGLVELIRGVAAGLVILDILDERLLISMTSADSTTNQEPMDVSR